jgi:hypothetical protein
MDHADRFGSAVAGPGDFSGDDEADVLVGAPLTDLGSAPAGVAWIVPGRVTGSVEVQDIGVGLVATESYDGTGTAVAAAGDLDGDGRGDIAIGSPSACCTGSPGHVAVFYGGSLDASFGTEYRQLPIALAAATLSGQAADAATGFAIAGGRDVSGDGHPDLLVGAPQAGPTEAGAWLLVGGGW